jgi:hypothetical protein
MRRACRITAAAPANPNAARRPIRFRMSASHRVLRRSMATPLLVGQRDGRDVTE